jgi:methionyl-tRNA formyltransferase
MQWNEVAVLTTKGGWFEPYAKGLVEKIRELGCESHLYFRAEEVPSRAEVVFMLSVYQLVKKKDLDRHRHNLVIHPSALPQGKGWAPLAWQVLEGKNKIPIVLFEAVEAVDAGQIYLKDVIQLDGGELNEEIRDKQGKKLIEMSLCFLRDYEKIKPVDQEGKESFYPRRTADDSEIDLTKPLIEQINLLRICCNKEYPPFFFYQGKKYILNIFSEQEEHEKNSQSSL